MQKTCIVTGGSSGIGYCIVKNFITDGFEVFNLDIKPSKFEKFIHCDVSVSSQLENALAQIIATTESIDTLILNAGIHFSANIENTSEDDFYRVINLNVKSAFVAIKKVLPFMKKAKKGSIILIASDQSFIAKPNSFIYNLTKHALASIVKTTAIDYSKYGIRVNGVCPGTIETPLYHNAINHYCQKNNLNSKEVHESEKQVIPLGRLGTAEEVASFVSFLADEKNSFITGSLQLIDGGYTCQ